MVIMRINVYSQELITEDTQARQLETILKESDTGVTYTAVRMYLASPRELHFSDDDDDRSAITFWLPKSGKRRKWLATSFNALAQMVLDAPPEMGMD